MLTRLISTPVGRVDPSGSQTVKGEPKKTDVGPVDESMTYTLSATNVCGGSATQTAAIHITGSIEPIPEVVLQSVFYPTDYPDEKHPEVGLVKSQQLDLATLAARVQEVSRVRSGRKAVSGSSRGYSRLGTL